jgi:predicted MFS family arabinose efflux permease
VDALGSRIFVLQAALGASFVLVFNATITLATDDAPPRHLGRVIGIIGAVNMATNALGTVMAERLADFFGWRTVFSVAAVLSFLALGLVALVRDEHHRVTVDPKAPSFAMTIRGPLSTILTISMILGGTFVALFTFVQPYALDLGATNVSSFYVGFTTAAVCVRLGFGGLGDQHGRRRVSALALVAYAGVTASATWMGPGYIWVYGALFGLAHGVAYPTLNALAIEHAPPVHRGRSIMLFNGLFNLGASFATYVWGIVAEHGGYRSIFVPAALLASSAVVLLVGSSLRASGASARPIIEDSPQG